MNTAELTGAKELSKNPPDGKTSTTVQSGDPEDRWPGAVTVTYPHIGEVVIL